MTQWPVYARISGPIVMVGFGSIGKGTLPLIERHLTYDKSRITVLDPKDEGRKALCEKHGVRFIQQGVTRENYRELLTPLLTEGGGQGFCVNLSVDTSSVDIMELCNELGALYIDTVNEPWLGFYFDASKGAAARSNYALRETTLAAKKARRPGSTTAISCCGANPGMVSFFVKQALLDYNGQDCEALELVANRLVDLRRAAPAGGRSSQREVVLTSDMKRENPYHFGRIAFALPEMETINKAAYWDYQRERVYVKSGKKVAHRSVPATTRHDKPKPNATIGYQAASHCPNCKSMKIYSHGTRSKIVIDLRFMKYGIKRWVVRYMIHRQRCQSCGTIFKATDLRWTPAKYGWDLIAYAMYQNIELHLSQISIDTSMSKLFGLPLPHGWTNKMKPAAAQSYAITHDRLVRKLCSGHLLHIDETSISVRGFNGYVWALASMEEVAYFFTPTREGNTIQELLKTFSGVLVSDFYAAYDAIDCPQQKCLIHFIRDLNSAILEHPFDDGLKQLAANFADVVKPIIDTVDRRGLKKRFLSKFRKSIDRFYKGLVDDDAGQAEDIRRHGEGES
jgi:predicted Zn-ribbon and HTH transcriptional regulator